VAVVLWKPAQAPLLIYTLVFAGGVTLQGETVRVSVPLFHEDALIVADRIAGMSRPEIPAVAGPVFLCGEIDVVQLSGDLRTLKQHVWPLVYPP
jgi:hypothetical protein